MEEPAAEATDPAPTATPPEAPAAPVSAPSLTPHADDPAEVRRAFEALLAELEPVHRRPDPRVDCAMGCAYQNDTRLVVVTASGVEEDGTPTGFEVVAAGRSPLLRWVPIPEVADTEEEANAWLAYQDDEGPAPWLDALRDAMPTLAASRPATDLVTHEASRDFSLSTYAPLVGLGGPMDGRFLFWFESRYAHHLYLLHGPEHQMRWIASLPITVELCPGTDALAACAQPVGIQRVYAVPGAPQLLVQLFHPIAGDGGYSYSALTVPLGDDDALAATEAQGAAEIEASLSAPGRRVHPFALPFDDDAPCPVGCVFFRRDGSHSWVFPGSLRDGESPTRSVRRRDGSIEVLVPEESAVTTAREDAGEEASLGRDIVARALIAGEGVTAFSPLVELGPPHMGRRLVLEGEPGHEVLLWVEGERRIEVGHVTYDPAEPTGPFGIDRVIVPEGAGYPLIVVTYAAIRPNRTEHRMRHRVEVLTIAGPPAEPEARAEGAN